MAKLLIAAAHKSSGKTTITLGLCAALAQRGMNVRPFKKGPDYIDPMWLSLASKRPCHNLDFHTMDATEIQQVFDRQSAGGDISIIEGNKGLFDGVDIEGSNSNAALAKLLNTPVVLVIDTRGMTRGIAPLLLGYQAFDRNLNIAGVILNKVGGHRHAEKLRAIVEHYTDIPVLGIVQHDSELEISERHLGLIPSNESDVADQKLARIVKSIKQQVNLEQLIAIAQNGEQVPKTHFLVKSPLTKTKVRIGITRDAAFGFYYQGDIEALEHAGAELVTIDTLNDACLPRVDGLFLGGGFPETQAAALEANHSLRSDIRHAIENGLPAYAECGGLMYLSRSLRWGENVYQMVGAVPGDTVMHDKPQGRGYMRLRQTGNGHWPLLNADRTYSTFNAHEFHYSSLENLDPNIEFAYEVLRGNGITGSHDGLVYKNLVASYAHFRDVAQNRWASRFVGFVKERRQTSACINLTLSA